MNQEKNCPFCLPFIWRSCFISSENFMAIYNIAPIFPGHSLVLPKKHITSFKYIEPVLLAEMMELVQKTVCVLEKAFCTEGFDLTIQDGACAGQTIEHMHTHILPRKKGDLPSPGDWYPLFEDHKNDFLDSKDRPKLKTKDLQEIVSYLKSI